jgi:hypothetical protein
VFTVDDIGENIPTLSDNYPNMPHINIKTEGVEKLMNNLDPSKVTRPDEIPARILKEYAHEFAPHLASFYNISLSRGEVPSDWRQVNVIPVFKKGEKYLANNYRPVSLTCTCCKVLKHIVVSNMMKHLEIHDILVDCQHGFRAKRSGETQLISLTHELIYNLHSGIQNDLIIIDFSKAFDKVPHKKLLCKLDNYGIRDNTLKWIGSFLHNIMQQVVLDGESSSKLPVVSGVPPEVCPGTPSLSHVY